MHWADERSAFEQRLSDGFTDCPVQYSGVPFNAPADSSWVRARITPNVSRRATLGVGGITRVQGLIIFQVFAPSNKGSQEARTLADSLSALFNDVTFSYGSSGFITCWEPELTDVGPTAEGSWYQVNLMVPYWRDVTP